MPAISNLCKKNLVPSCIKVAVLLLFYYTSQIKALFMIVDKLRTPKHNCIHLMQYGMVDSNSDRDHDLLIAIMVCTIIMRT